jgi:MFS family permease
VSGFISDRIGWKKVLAFSLFGMALSMICILLLKTQWTLYLFVFVFGICSGVRSPAQVGILSAFFGMRSVGELIGITSGISQLISAFAPYIAGFIFDTTGSYFIPFIIVMVFLFASSLFANTIRKPLVTSKQHG